MHGLLFHPIFVTNARTQSVIERLSDEQRRALVPVWGRLYDERYPQTTLRELGTPSPITVSPPAKGDETRVSEDELMSALVLCLIAGFEASHARSRRAARGECKKRWVSCSSSIEGGAPTTPDEAGEPEEAITTSVDVSPADRNSCLVLTIVPQDYVPRVVSTLLRVLACTPTTQPEVIKTMLAAELLGESANRCG